MVGMKAKAAIGAIAVLALLLAPAVASAANVSIIKAEVQGFAIHVEWVTDTPIGYFLIYLDGQLVGYKPAWDVQGNVYVFEYPAIAYFTRVTVEQYDPSGQLIGWDMAYIDWSSAGSGNIGIAPPTPPIGVSPPIL